MKRRMWFLPILGQAAVGLALVGCGGTEPAPGPAAPAGPTAATAPATEGAAAEAAPEAAAMADTKEVKIAVPGMV